jgi:uncharacterized protein YgiM (DUF1202 family)
MASTGFPIAVVTTLLLVTGGALVLTPKDILRSTLVPDKSVHVADMEVTSSPDLPLPAESNRPVIQYASLIVQVTPLSEPESELAEETASVPAGDIRWITAQGLNMRAEPNKFADLLTSLPFGTQVSVSETSGTWARVTAPDGTTGWLSAKFLTNEGPVAE